jgi:hypothetical protein
VVGTYWHPKILGPVLRMHTHEVVRTHSLVLCAPKEMHEEFHKVHIGLSFVSSTPSIKTTKYAPV